MAQFINPPPAQAPLAEVRLRQLGYTPNEDERRLVELFGGAEIFASDAWFRYFAYFSARLEEIAASAGSGSGGAIVYAAPNLTADATVNHAAPVANGALLVVEVTSDGLGQWVVTWGANFDASVTEQPDQLRTSVYLFYGKGGKWFLLAQPVYR